MHLNLYGIFSIIFLKQNGYKFFSKETEAKTIRKEGKKKEKKI